MNYKTTGNEFISCLKCDEFCKDCGIDIDPTSDFCNCGNVCVRCRLFCDNIMCSHNDIYCLGCIILCKKCQKATCGYDTCIDEDGFCKDCEICINNKIENFQRQKTSVIYRKFFTFLRLFTSHNSCKYPTGRVFKRLKKQYS